jgi:ethanolamine permease
LAAGGWQVEADGEGWRGDDYFERRRLSRSVGPGRLWGLGVGAAIYGQMSGWNLGLASGGWGGLMIAAALSATMYLGLILSLAEMASAQPHAGGSYAYARTALGPWAGLATGLCAALQYLLISAVCCFYIGAALGRLLGTGPAMQPLYWVTTYAVLLAVNARGAGVALRIALVLTLLTLAAIAVFCASALPHADMARYALDVAPGGGAGLALGHGPFLPRGLRGAASELPCAIWLFLAIEQIPLAAEEARRPRRNLPRAML